MREIVNKIIMAKIKDIPKGNRSREKFLQNDPESLSKSDLLAILLGSGVKGKNVQQLSQQIIRKFDKNFLNITVDDLQKVSGIGQAKALRIASAISLVKRFYTDKKTNAKRDSDSVAEGEQATLFDSSRIEKSIYKVKKYYFQPQKLKNGYFQLQNRRYLGNKYKLLGFIEDIISEKCGLISSFCDIFAGTGVVGERFNNPEIKVISNDFLYANYVCLQTFLDIDEDAQRNSVEKINHLNNLENNKENYFSTYFGGTYFSNENAIKIGAIREEIENIAEHDSERSILICSLLYATDRVANTVGHYDAFRKKLDMLRPVKLLIPDIDYSNNQSNEIYKEGANILIRKISCDVLYIDPPYNSRQYSDAYHLLENLAEWKKPNVVGIGKKMNRSHIKSNYCLKSATQSFEDLISNANCKHILFSYNNTGDSKDGRSNARMNDDEIFQILNDKGEVEIFEKDYKSFTTGKSNGENNVERIFYCKVIK